MHALPQIDIRNLMQPAVGPHGLAERELATHQPALAAARARLSAAAGGAGHGFERAVSPPDELVARIQELARRLREEADDLVILGIGGSALGTICLRTALAHPLHNSLPAGKRGGPRLHVLDNVDPATFHALFDLVDLARTRFVVVTKSGGTPETMAGYLVARERVERAGLAVSEALVAITDPEKGLLRRIARADRLASLPVPPDLGGRFSVLAAVGLLPAACIGIDIGELLAGARAMRQTCLEATAEEDPAGRIALATVLLDRLRNLRIAVMMPYSDPLRDFADWFRQLWAESLGKARDRSGRLVLTGQTPVKALGTTDQHSQVQLYIEGPFDKHFTFVRATRHEPDLRIPELHPGEAVLESIQGRTLGQLLEAEAEATSRALTRAGRPNMTVTVERVSAWNMGALFYLYERAVALAGELYDVDAFDQPGVEAGKVLTREIMEKIPKT